MTTLLILSVVASVMLIGAGLRACCQPAQAAPEFARFTNGRNTDDGLKAHRSR